MSIINYIFHSEGLVHPGTYSAQANDSSRQMLVSENKVVEHNDIFRIADGV